MTISEQANTTSTDPMSAPNIPTLPSPISPIKDSHSSSSPITTQSHGSPQPSFTLDINQTALIDVISGEILRDPCFSDCGCHLTLSRSTWMTIPRIDGERICPNRECNRPFNILSTNTLVASLLKTTGTITPIEHFEKQKKVEETAKLLTSFDTNIDEENTETASEILKELQKVLPHDSSELQSRTKVLFEKMEMNLKKRRLPPSSPPQGNLSKRQKKGTSAGLSQHELRIIKIRERREKLMDLSIKQEVLEKMMVDNDDDSDIDRTPQLTIPAPTLQHFEIPSIVTLSQVFSKFGAKETFATYDILVFISELIENNSDLDDRQKRDVIDPLWRDCFNAANGVELTKPQLKNFLTAINAGYKNYIANLATPMSVQLSSSVNIEPMEPSEKIVISLSSDDDDEDFIESILNNKSNFSSKDFGFD